MTTNAPRSIPENLDFPSKIPPAPPAKKSVMDHCPNAKKCVLGDGEVA
jgi:hypothetical protein